MKAGFVVVAGIFGLLTACKSGSDSEHEPDAAEAADAADATDACSSSCDCDGGDASDGEAGCALPKKDAGVEIYDASPDAEPDAPDDAGQKCHGDASGAYNATFTDCNVVIGTPAYQLTINQFVPALFSVSIGMLFPSEPSVGGYDLSNTYPGTAQIIPDLSGNAWVASAGSGTSIGSMHIELTSIDASVPGILRPHGTWSGTLIHNYPDHSPVTFTGEF